MLFLRYSLAGEVMQSARHPVIDSEKCMEHGLQ